MIKNCEKLVHNPYKPLSTARKDNFDPYGSKRSIGESTRRNRHTRSFSNLTSTQINSLYNVDNSIYIAEKKTNDYTMGIAFRRNTKNQNQSF